MRTGARSGGLFSVRHDAQFLQLFPVKSAGFLHFSGTPACHLSAIRVRLCETEVAGLFSCFRTLSDVFERIMAVIFLRRMEKTSFIHFCNTFRPFGQKRGAPFGARASRNRWTPIGFHEKSSKIKKIQENQRNFIVLEGAARIFRRFGK